MLQHWKKTNEHQTRNHQLHDGSITPFVVLPFKDGIMPMQAPVSSSSLNS
jgi:hypothetical protein